MASQSDGKRPTTRTSGGLTRARHPYVRRGGPKHVRRQSLFFGIVAGHGGVEPGAGVAPAAGGGGQGTISLEKKAGLAAIADSDGPSPHLRSPLAPGPGAAVARPPRSVVHAVVAVGVRRVRLDVAVDGVGHDLLL